MGCILEGEFRGRGLGLREEGGGGDGTVSEVNMLAVISRIKLITIVISM